MLTGNWIMTLFAGYFPYKMFIPVMDNFFREGWTAIYRISLALLKMWESELAEVLKDVKVPILPIHIARKPPKEKNRFSQLKSLTKGVIKVSYGNSRTAL